MFHRHNSAILVINQRFIDGYGIGLTQKSANAPS
jgi:hypothetical protein